MLLIWSVTISAQNKFKQIDKSQSVNIPSHLEISKTFNGSDQTRSLDTNYKLKPLTNLNVNTSGLKGSYYNSNLTPTYIEGTLKNGKSFKSFNENVQGYIDEARPLMRAVDQKISFEPKETWTDDLKSKHQKLNQYYDGIPVYGAELIVHTNKKGFVHALNGNYLPSNLLKVSIEASKTVDEIKSIVSSKLKNYKPNLDKEIKSNRIKLDFDQWKIDLVLYPIENQENKIVLAYHVEVYANLADYRTFIVDANTGEVLDNHSNLCQLHHDGHTKNHSHATHESSHESIVAFGPEVSNGFDLLGEQRTINTYSENGNFFMIDASRTMFNSFSSNLPDDPVGVIWTIDAGNTAPQNDNFDYDHVRASSNNWSQSPEAVSAQFNAGRAYDYFKIVHNRESINGKGANIVSFVNVADEDGGGMDNAFWNGLAIWYGNGKSEFLPLARSLDVAGHELTHGVVQETANFRYKGESGALNESFADIFGTMIERENWAVGENVVKPGIFPGGALRNLADPHNGAPTGDFGRGWQPKVYNERYTGSQDNGGVHLNSGIPNHAYYLFATEIGIEKAEQVYYRAMTTYLTKSAQFTDLRLAVVQSAKDLYDDNTAAMAETAFDAVGIVGGQQQNYEQEYELNEGQDLILYTTVGRDQLILVDGALNTIANPLTDTDIRSKPSVTDAGDDIVFIGNDKRMYNILIDWTGGSFEEVVIQEDPIWRNAVISKDGRWIAALTELDEVNDNEIIIFDLENGGNETFTLYNPTFTEGVSTGEVLYADAMEFDFTNHTLVYDAINKIESSTAGDLEYWDIGFLNFWDGASNNWVQTDPIEKLFSALPKGVSVGNPTFSKNSPHILALDYFDENEMVGWQIVGVNVETGEIELIKINEDIAYPNYSRDDKFVIHNSISGIAGTSLLITPLADSKITGDGDATAELINSAQWGVWFSNGEREFTSGIFETEVIREGVHIYPNPSSLQVNIELPADADKIERLEVFDLAGKKIIDESSSYNVTRNKYQLDISNLRPGLYNVLMSGKDKTYNATFVKE